VTRLDDELAVEPPNEAPWRAVRWPGDPYGPLNHAAEVLARADRLWAQRQWVDGGRWAEALRGGDRFRRVHACPGCFHDIAIHPRSCDVCGCGYFLDDQYQPTPQVYTNSEGP
jgi:hypothetical protein